jgi:hypothetical protein
MASKCKSWVVHMTWYLGCECLDVNSAALGGKGLRKCPPLMTGVAKRTAGNAW